ncbi:MAG TPA: hypothetical protein VG435_20140 [Acidimicrobiales bacterium]|jgi:uncharacterized membrane protein YgcG|nr:hypothetical protein [Acidimicrobiales bacterium]
MTAISEPITNESVTARREEKLLRLLERASASSRFNFGERWLFGLGGALVVAGFVVVVIGWVGASHTVLVAGQIPYLISGGLIGIGLIFVGAFLYFGHWVAVLVRESRERGAEDRDDLALVRRNLEDVSRSLALIAQAVAEAPGSFRPALAGAPVNLAASAPSIVSPVRPEAPSGGVGRPDSSAGRLDSSSGRSGSSSGRSGSSSGRSDSSAGRSGPSAARSGVDQTAPILLATPTGSMAHRPGCRVLAGKADLRPVQVEDGLKPCGMCRPLDPGGAP